MITNRFRVLACLISAAALSAGCGGDGHDSGSGPLGTATEALAPAGSNALFVSSANLPASLFPGERRWVTVTMQNNGTTAGTDTWTTSYTLTSTNSAWGWASTLVGSPVAVGLSNTFPILITAPTTSSSFTGTMALGNSYFGQPASVPVTISNAVVPQWGCTYVPGSSTIPATLTPGENRAVTITVKNTGSATWPSTSLALASEDTPVALWNQNEATTSTTTAPNATQTYGITITAPTTPGTYSFLREMRDKAGVQDFRRSGFCVTQSIVVAGTSILNSQVVSQNFPTSMAPGDTSTVTVVMKNSGTQTWAADGTYSLYSQNTPSGLWGTVSKAVGTATIAGANATIAFNVTAPTTAGTYTEAWQMRKSTGVDAGFFGAVISVSVNVNSSVTPSLNASVVSQTIPTLVTAGSFPTFSVTMKNTGSSAWTGNVYGLYSTNSPTSLWNTAYTLLGTSETIAANANKVFSFSVKAPATAGTYSSSWRMHSGNVGYFGTTATTSNITVTLCGNHTIDSGEQCDDGNLTNGDGCSNLCQFEQTPVDLSTGGASDHEYLGAAGNGQLSAVTIADVTGDGVADVMMSSLAPKPGVSRASSGWVYGYKGAITFAGASTTVPSGDAFEIGGAEANDNLATLANGALLAGQIVGDATKDVIVSAPGADGPSNGRSSCGEVYVIQGGTALGTAGLINLGATTLPTQVTVHVIGKNAGDGLIALGVGDLTGDGVNDLVLGAPGDGTNGSAAGAIYIIQGGSLSGDIDLASPPGGVIVYRIVGATAGDGLGTRAAIGDMNGDGFADILAGCPNSAPGGRTRSGAAFAKFGHITTNLDFSQTVGTADGPSAKWLGKTAFDGFGISTAIGNVTGTSKNEAVIGAIQARNGANTVGGVTIWSNVTSGTTYDQSTSAVPTSVIYGADTSDDCGTALALGDINKDGLLDIAFGCSLADGPTNARTSAGEVDVVLGQPTLPATYDLNILKSQFVVYGPDAGGETARQVPSLSVGDLDGDGFADLCMGSFLAGTSHVGRVDCVSSPY